MVQSYFLGTTELNEAALARVGSKDSLDSYPELIEIVRARCGNEVASLFAEPVRRMNRATQTQSVTWYCAHEGTPFAFAQLDGTALRSVCDLLRKRLKAFSSLFGDPEYGSAFASWFYVLSPSDIVSVAGQPVITNWGMAPASLAASEEGREANYRRTVEPYAPKIPLPPFNVEEGRSFPQRLKQFELSQRSLASRATLGVFAQSASAAEPGPAPQGTLAAVPSSIRSRSWVAPAIASLVAAVMLGAIVYFHLLVPPPVVPPPSDQIELQKATNKALEDRLRQLRSAATKVCQYVPGQENPPNGGNFGPLLPVRPDRARVEVQPPPGQSQPRSSTMAELLDKATVLIVSNGTGSGFFISPTDIVTNHHVTQDEQQVMVGNRALGALYPAKVVAVGRGRVRGTQDLAVVRIEPKSGPEPLRIGVVPSRLRPVYASGFPGAVISTIAHEASGKFPEANITTGIVASRQNQRPDGIGTIIHTAQIGHGNSGGPLVDQGGCVVGVNSWLSLDADESQNYQTYDQSLDAAELRRFLHEKGIRYFAADGECAASAPLEPDAAPRPASVPQGQPSPPPPQRP